MRTNELRRVIEARLQDIKQTYGVAEVSHRLASEDAMFPHIVWDINRIEPTDLGREDYEVDVHIWTKSDIYKAYEIADAVAATFRFANIPQATILPTFYETNTMKVEDPDKTIVHLVVRIEGQAYETNGGGDVWQQ